VTKWLTKETMIALRAAALSLVAALDRALLEAYGWRPHTPRQTVDASDRIQA
jgi:hypothetical protein